MTCHFLQLGQRLRVISSQTSKVRKTNDINQLYIIVFSCHLENKAGKPPRLPALFPGRKWRERKAKLACKPGSVRPLSRSRQSFIWAASRLAARATYPGAARATLSPPYLVLLRMGFGVPSVLPRPRWALTRQPRGCQRLGRRSPFHHRRPHC